MKKRIMKKQILSMILCICMMLSLLPTRALAEGTGSQEETSTIAVTIGETTTYYADQAEGWNAAIEAQTATVKLLADWTAVNGSFGTGAGFGNDYAHTGNLYIPDSRDITLDLNGHNVDRALSTPTGEGYVIFIHDTTTTSSKLTICDSSSTDVANQGSIRGGYNSTGGAGGIYVLGQLTLTGGNITGNKSISWGGGIYIGNGSSRSFTMTGGKISGNVASYNNDDDGGAGGIFSYSPITMTGGEISGNYACGSCLGGGVYLYSNATMTVGGTAKITGNYSGATFSSDPATGGSMDNIYLLTGKTITCSTTTPLSTGASIGVTLQGNGGEGAVTGSNSADYSSYFTSDAGYDSVNTGSGSSQIVKQQATVVDAEEPVIDTNLSTTEVTYNQDDTPDNMTIVAHSTDGGTLSYQWYWNTVNSYEGMTDIVQATGQSWQPYTDMAGTFYYYCEVRNCNNDVNGTTVASTRSNIAKVTVKAPASNVMSVDFDGDGDNDPTLYTDFAEGWAAAVGGSNTADTTVQLLADWTTTAALVVPTGKSITLDLNGQTINRNLSQATNDGYVLSVVGTLTIIDNSTPDTGTITGGYTDTDSAASGIYVTGTLYLLGGSVSDNQEGYGVIRSGTGTITVGGTAVIKDNTYDDGSHVYQRNLLWDKSKCSISATTQLESGAEIHITTNTPTLRGQVLVTNSNVTSNTADYFATDLGDEYEVAVKGNSLYVKDKTRTVTFRITKDGAAYTLPDDYEVRVNKHGEDGNGGGDGNSITGENLQNGVDLAVGENDLIMRRRTNGSASDQMQTAMTVNVTEGSGTQNITLAYYSLDIKDSANNLNLLGTTLPLITPMIENVQIGVIPTPNRRLVQLKSATMGGNAMTTSDYDYETGALDLIGVAVLHQVTGAVAIDIETSNEFPVALDGGQKAVSTINWSTRCDTSWLGSNYDTQTEWSISTPAQLAAFAAAVNDGKDFSEKTVKLTADLDMSGYLWTPIGVLSYNNGSKAFSGIFDGQGHSISGLFENELTTEAENAGAGLFALNEGTIQSLTVKNSLIASDYNVAIAAAMNMGTMDDVLVKNSSVFAEYYAGGITAVNYTTVKNCGVDAKIVDSYADEACGGMIASTNNDGATIQNCWSLGSIKGDCIGGITGENAGTISNCWSAATTESDRESITHHNDVNNTHGTIENCYGIAGKDITYTQDAGTVTGCGTFASDTGVLTAGTVENCGSAQTFTYGSTSLLTALNGWVGAQATPADYSNWIQPSVDAGTYPGFKSEPVEAKDSIFQAKFYEPQLWDCQRSPAFPVEGRSFCISGLKAPYDQNLRKINFASSDDYVTFEYVSDLSELPTDVQNRIVNSVKWYTNATEQEIKEGAVVKEILHSGTNQATTTTLSTYGLVWALGEEGFLYTALDGAYKYSGGVGTFVSFKAHKSGDSVIYTTD